jgi:hypothetical protein
MMIGTEAGMTETMIWAMADAAVVAAGAADVAAVADDVCTVAKSAASASRKLI